MIIAAHKEIAEFVTRLSWNFRTLSFSPRLPLSGRHDLGVRGLLEWYKGNSPMLQCRATHHCRTISYFAQSIAQPTAPCFFLQLPPPRRDCMRDLAAPILSSLISAGLPHSLLPRCRSPARFLSSSSSSSSFIISGRSVACIVFYGGATVKSSQYDRLTAAAGCE